MTEKTKWDLVFYLSGMLSGAISALVVARFLLGWH